MKYNIEKVREIVGNNIKIYSVKFLGEGNHCEAFCLNENLVIKLPKHKTASKCLETEIKVLEQLQNKLNLEIPNVILKGKFINNNENFVYFVSKKLQGKSLSKSEFLILPQSIKQKCAADIAKFLYILHNQKQIFNIKRKDFVMLHGDFSLNHVLFDNNNYPCGILDFADVRTGKHMSDFLYMLDDNDDEEFGKEFGVLVLNKYNQLAKEHNYEYNI